MQPIRSVKNRYRGINAHLHSFWQAEGEWNNFHNRHIGDLAGFLRQKLLPMGYTAIMEESLQIRRIDEGNRPISDLTIYDLKPARYTQQPASTAPILTGLVVPLAPVLPDEVIAEKPYRAVVIYKRSQEQKPVAWVELLSPSNKRGGDDTKEYLNKRNNLLENSIVFVEIDYLHETPPTLLLVPDYSQKRQIGSHPYRIAVLDPRPRIADGVISLNEFKVDDTIPTVNIPLNDDEFLSFDFDAPYQKQFEEMVYGLEYIDYSELPINFNRYNEADQLRIITRMLTVLEAAKQGHDLEQGPFPLIQTPGSIEAALERLEKIKTGDSM